jgi:hypothetical protein
MNPINIQQIYNAQNNVFSAEVNIEANTSPMNERYKLMSAPDMNFKADII